MPNQSILDHADPFSSLRSLAGLMLASKEAKQDGPSGVDRIRILSGLQESPNKEQIKKEYYDDLASGAMNSMGAGAPLAIGSVKSGVPNDVLERILWGKDATEMSPKELGKWAKQISPFNDTQTMWLQMNGARDLDKYGTKELRDIARITAKESKIPLEKLPDAGTITSEMAPTGTKGALGYHDPTNNKIRLIADNIDQIQVPNPELLEGGIARHEVQHWKEAQLYPDFQSRREVIGSGPKIDYFNLQGFHNPSRMAEFLRQVKANPGEYQLHPVIEKALSEGMSPEWLSQSHARDLIIPDMNQAYMHAQFGKDPAFAQQMKSLGHFKEYKAFEPQYAQKSLAEQNLRAGGEVHPEILKAFPELKQVTEEYESPIRPGGSNYVTREPVSQSDTIAATVGKVLGLMGLSTGATYGIGKYLEQDKSDSKANPKAHDADYKILEGAREKDAADLNDDELNRLLHDLGDRYPGK
jgi:hypothetical protein